uniref:Ubiquitin carboxyl-terminal hydrolase n=1 Tax=Gadus morhua TaxID=8049 RepID=A0A8C5B647_GADMO
MRLKDPFSLRAADMTKRTNRPRKPRDEDSSDEVSGLTCQHVSKAVDLSSVKKMVSASMWSVCSDCLRERALIDGEPACSHDILVCLKCGYQGCNQSETQHSTKHHHALHSESHCITISLSTWKAWCFECNEELSTHCNKKALAQTLDFLQKHSVKATSGTILKLREEAADHVDPARGKSSAFNSTLAAVKGINNLGNTCFFNAVMQNLSQTHMLIDLIQELKEKGYKMRICPPAESNLSLLTVTLPSPEPLTSAMFLFLHTMKEPGKGPISPKILFNQLCQKAPRFKGYQQQDSQELLHYLLDSIRVEETKRVKASILKAFNNPTEKTADEETKRHVKAYGKEGVKLNFVDRIFVGELTNTIMCEECGHVSRVWRLGQYFNLITMSPWVKRAPRILKVCCLLTGRSSIEHIVTLNKHIVKLVSSLFHPLRRSSGSVEEEGADRPHEDEEEAPLAAAVAAAAAARPVVGAGSLLSRVGSVGSHSDSSDKDPCAQDSSNDADSEASESEWTPRPPSRYGRAGPLVSAVSKMNLGPSFPGEGSPAARFPAEDTVEKAAPLARDNLHHHHHQQQQHHPLPQGAFQALSHSYTPSSKECSVQSCLHQFTSVELLMGNNKLLCESCTERRQKTLRKSGSADKRSEKVYTSARKHILISSLPPVVTLHLKRFHQAGMNLRKVNRHVDFPLVLDLAPFCSATCKNLGSGERVPYSLYGIVEHSGSMRGGHYTAYVRVRPPQRRAEHQRRNASGKEASGPSQSQWVYVSDTTVQTVPESRVLNSQAYLLFYEEML